MSLSSSVHKTSPFLCIPLSFTLWFLRIYFLIFKAWLNLFLVNATAADAKQSEAHFANMLHSISSGAINNVAFILRTVPNISYPREKWFPTPFSRDLFDFKNVTILSHILYWTHHLLHSLNYTLVSSTKNGWIEKNHEKMWHECGLTLSSRFIWKIDLLQNLVPLPW